MTVIHQDETPAAPHPIDMLERAVEDNGWAFRAGGARRAQPLGRGHAGATIISTSPGATTCSRCICRRAFDMRISDEVRRQQCRRPADVCERAAVDRPFRPLAGGRHHRLPPRDDLPRRAKPAPRNARRCSISRWKPASITTRRSSSCCGAARPPKKPSPPRCWSARGRRKDFTSPSWGGRRAKRVGWGAGPSAGIPPPEKRFAFFDLPTRGRLDEPHPPHRCRPHGRRHAERLACRRSRAGDRGRDQSLAVSEEARRAHRAAMSRAKRSVPASSRSSRRSCATRPCG